MESNTIKTSYQMSNFKNNFVSRGMLNFADGSKYEGEF